MGEYFCKACRRNCLDENLKRFCPICGGNNLNSLNEKRVAEIFSFIPNEDSLRTANVATYELGDLIKRLFYAQIYPDRRNCLIEAKIAMSDLIAQCHIICKREKWNFAEIETLGINRAHERIQRRLDLGE